MNDNKNEKESFGREFINLIEVLALGMISLLVYHLAVTSNLIG